MLTLVELRLTSACTALSDAALQLGRRPVTPGEDPVGRQGHGPVEPVRRVALGVEGGLALGLASAAVFMMHRFWRRAVPRLAGAHGPARAIVS